MSFRDNALESQRWIPARSDNEYYVIPGWSPVYVKGAETRNGRYTLVVDQYRANPPLNGVLPAPKSIYFVGPEGIPYQGHGRVTRTFPVRTVYRYGNTESVWTPIAGEIVGFGSTFTAPLGISRQGTGYRILGNATPYPPNSGNGNGGLVWIDEVDLSPSYVRAAVTTGSPAGNPQGLSIWQIKGNVAGGHTLVGGTIQIGSAGLYAVHVWCTVYYGEPFTDMYLELSRQRVNGSPAKTDLVAPFYVGNTTTPSSFTDTDISTFVSMAGHIDCRSGDKLSLAIYYPHGTGAFSLGTPVGGQIFLVRIDNVQDPGLSDGPYPV